MEGDKQRKLLHYCSIEGGRYYDLIRRYRRSNQDNWEIAYASWLLELDKHAIVTYVREDSEEGYWRFTYMMIDENVSYVSPSSEYHALKNAGLLSKFNSLISTGKCKGYIQCEACHKE